MKGESYKNVNAYFAGTKARNTTIKALHDVLPLIMYIFYPIQLATLAVNEGFGNVLFLKFLISVIRLAINAKRPYEVYDYTPAVNKNTLGKSFPSRHTVSAFIIAMGFLYINTTLGIIMLCLATAIGLTRILSGVHFVRDVIGGAAIGVIIGILGFFIF